MSLNSNSAKDRAARAGAALVADRMIVGLGSGSTAALMVEHLADRVRSERLTIAGIATSIETAELARRLGLPLRQLDEVPAVDLNLDGADEIDPEYRMIKGRGGALLREKIVAASASRRVTMITGDKRVGRLGIKVALPVEVSTFGLEHTERRVRELGATTAIRRRPDGAVALTDGGNAIIDCHFADPGDPATLDARLQCLPGVLDTGLFIGLCDTLIIGSDDGVEIIETGARGGPRLDNPPD